MASGSRRVFGGAVLFAGLVLGGAECSTSTEAMREWTPADHVHPASSNVDADRIPDESRKGATEEQIASAFWETACARCHGLNGRGVRGSLTAEVPNFADQAWQRNAKDEQLVATIQSGRGAMPAFRNQFSDPQIVMLVHHIRRFGAKSPQSPPTP